MKRGIRENDAACKNSATPIDRMERNKMERDRMARNEMARNKRRVNDLATIGLTGIITAGMGLTGCENYGLSSEIKAETQSEGGEVSQDQGNLSAGEPSVAREEGSADRGSKVGTIKLDIERATTPAPQSKDISDTVCMKLSDGGSVRIRSVCDTGGNSNILTYANPGTELKRTGKGEQQTRIGYNEAPSYISSRYIITQVSETTASPPRACANSREVALSPSRGYAELSEIYPGMAVLYHSETTGLKGITACVSTGHEIKDGTPVRTLCHPGGTPRVAGGITSAGATSAAIVLGGITFANGAAENRVTLSAVKILKDKLLTAGYDVLTVRESDNVQLDNMARIVIVNNASDCRVALHQDSTTNSKGAFYMSVPNVESYRNMKPVGPHQQRHNVLGKSLVTGLKGTRIKIFSNSPMVMGLTQTFFSTMSSVDIELGDKASGRSAVALTTLANDLMVGMNQYLGQ